MFDKWKCIVNPLLDKSGEMSIITSDNVTVAKANIDKKMELAAHQHINEQITVVLDGEMVIDIGGKVQTVGKEEACIIPGNVVHKVSITKVPFRSFDIFSPVKEDFITSALEGEKDNV